MLHLLAEPSYDTRRVRQVAALAALEELCDAYDNRGFRKADHVRALFQQLRARIRAAVREEAPRPPEA